MVSPYLGVRTGHSQHSRNPATKGDSTMNRMSVARIAGTALLAAGLATSLSLPATATPQAASVGMLAAMQRDLGLTTDAALARIDQENVANAAAQTLTTRLGSDFAGTWFDSSTGRLVVA